jgi:hypothetical protein
MAADEEAYWAVPHPQLDAGLYIFSLSAGARLGSGGTMEDFTALGIDDASFAFLGRFTYERARTRYYAEYWAYAASNLHYLDHEVTWAGDTFLAAESVSVGFDFTYWGLGAEKILLDKPAFRLAASVGLNIADINFSITDTARGGSISETAPVLTVGVMGRFYLNDRWTICLEMVGLSWTDLIGMDGGFFDPSGEYKSLDVGFMWSKGGIPAVRLGYRAFSMRFENTEEAVAMTFSGAYIGMDFRW